MKQTSIGVVVSLASATALAQVVDFDTEAVGTPPAGWTCGAHGTSGTPLCFADR
jgi:hypothetical protein